MIGLVRKGGLPLVLILVLAVILRFALLATYPPALFVDEAAVGYNAWSLAQDLRDEYGTFLPVAFRSWGTYTAPLQFYLAIPGVLLWGLNEYGTRFHAVLLGSATVLVLYVLVYQWFGKRTLALSAATLLALSPWHIHQSRMAVESIISTFFFTLGVYFLVRFRAAYKLLPLVAAAICFVLTTYAYHSARLTAPLFLFLFMVLYRKELWRQLRNVLIAALVGIVIASPLLWYVITQHNQALARPRAISSIGNPGIGLQLWEWTTTDGPTHPSFLTRAFHNKAVLHLEDFFRRYLSHFDPSFLFIRGDPHERFQIPNIGILLFIGLPLVLVGFLSLFRFYPGKDRLLLVGWIMLPPVVSSLAVITPNSYHMLEAAPAWAILMAMGLSMWLRFLKPILPSTAHIALALLLTANVLYYLGVYYTVLPYQLAHFWAYGFKEGVLAVKELERGYDTVVSANRHYIYFLYYLRYNPRRFRLEYERAPGVDENGFEHIVAFGKFVFPKDFNWEQMPKRPGILYMAPRHQIPDYWTDDPEGSGLRRNKIRILKKIYFPNGEVAMKVADVIE